MNLCPRLPSASCTAGRCRRRHRQWPGLTHHRPGHHSVTSTNPVSDSLTRTDPDPEQSRRQALIQPMRSTSYRTVNARPSGSSSSSTTGCIAILSSRQAKHRPGSVGLLGPLRHTKSEHVALSNEFAFGVEPTDPTSPVSQHDFSNVPYTRPELPVVWCRLVMAPKSKSKEAANPLVGKWFHTLYEDTPNQPKKGRIGEWLWALSRRECSWVTSTTL